MEIRLKGAVIIYGGRWHRSEMFFVVNILLIQALTFDYPTSNINLKKYPPLGKNVTKGYHSVVTRVLYHFCDMSLRTACEFSAV
jgi:hypothetical protein